MERTYTYPPEVPVNEQAIEPVADPDHIDMIRGATIYDLEQVLVTSEALVKQVDPMAVDQTEDAKTLDLDAAREARAELVAQQYAEAMRNSITVNAKMIALQDEHPDIVINKTWYDSNVGNGEDAWERFQACFQILIDKKEAEIDAEAEEGKVIELADHRRPEGCVSDIKNPDNEVAQIIAMPGFNQRSGSEGGSVANNQIAA